MNDEFALEEVEGGSVHVKMKNFNDVLNENDTPHTDWVGRLADLLGTTRFIQCLTLFFFLWLGGNVLFDKWSGHAIDPAPFLLASTCINIYSAYTISILLKADKGQREREGLKHEHEFEVNRTTLAYNAVLLKELRETRKELKSIIIQKREDTNLQ